VISSRRFARWLAASRFSIRRRRHKFSNGCDPGRSQDNRLASLTPQERHVLDLIAEGMTNRQIGTELFLAEKP